MTLKVREASLPDDREEMLDLLRRNLPNRQEQGFDWRYQHNPAGPAFTWFIHSSDRNAAVAMTSLFPRDMYVDGKSMRAGQVMHFVVDANYRSLGPAVMLQRATFRPVNSGTLDFCYDCPPHDQGMSTFVRLGMRANCELTRYALLLRTDEYFQIRYGAASWTKPVIKVTNLFLGKRQNKSSAWLEVAEHTEDFTEEFTELDNQVATSRSVRRRRSQHDLNWLYRNNPERKHRVLVARRRGELIAFAVFIVQTDGIGSIVEVFGRELASAAIPLIHAIVDCCRRESLWAVHGHCSNLSELKDLFERAGFRRRERTARVVAYARPETPAGHLLSNGLRWAMDQVELL